ncbi:M61 family metallopeptidase [Hufsiella arboris]|nr:PDZ domain-containing protein [Hufsiella arboris]
MSEMVNAQQKINFNISFTEPQAHYVGVNMKVSGYKKEYVDVRMPVWTPGSYLVREFAKNVEEVAATSGSKKLDVRKLNKNTWRVYSKNADFDFNYRVYCFEISVRTSFVDDSHAFLSSTGIFMNIDNQIRQPVTVHVAPFKGWEKISTGLELVRGKQNTYYAPDFDILYDSPFEIGNQDIFHFTASGVDHEVAMYGGGNYDKTNLQRDMAKIVEQETAIYGENPNKHYTFIVHNYNVGSGGLEHLNSTVLGASRNAYATEAGYLNFLRLSAHEYFHLWNVKRLRPKALGPFDYNNENYTTNLWIAEGFTAYYDKLMVHRAGLQSSEGYLSALATDISTLENQPGKDIQPLSESSFDAWIKLYRPNENTKNSSISYYNKGAMIAFLLDLAIINSTNASKKLDNVMHDAYHEFYKKLNRGYTDQEFKAILEKTAGISFGEFYKDYINGLKPLDYNKYLGYAGFTLENTAVKNEPYLGIETTKRNDRLVVSNVWRGTGAWDGGLNVNDEIVAVDDVHISADDLAKIIAGKQVGDKISVQVLRDGLLKDLSVVLKENPLARFKISPVANPSVKQLAVRKKWLE